MTNSEYVASLCLEARRAIFSYLSRKLLLGLVLFIYPACEKASGQPLAPAERAEEIHAVSTPTGEAPLMTIEKLRELFGALDLSTETLKPVAAAVARGDFAKAKHELAEYYRNRTNVSWHFDPHHVDRNTPFNKQVADDAVKGRVMGGLIPVYANFPNGKIHWLYNETLHQRGATPYAGWQWQLCRMVFWNDMAAAYRATGDERYALAWVQQLRSFIIQCPPPVELPPPDLAPSAWHPIDTGVRMLGTWENAYFSFVLSPSISDDDLLTCVYGFLLTGQYLSTHHGPGNGLLMERDGIYMLSSIFPEFKEASQWRNDAIKGQMAQMAKQFMPDGVHEEISTGYHMGAVANSLDIARIAKLTGRFNEIPPEYIKPMEKGYDFVMYMATPDRLMPMFNDSWRVHVLGYMKEALQFFPDRQDFRWIATDGKEGQPPAKTSYAFDWAGLYAMRSGWDYHANYVAFRTGPFIFSHGHQDKLIVVMWAYGREILFNSGGGPYDGSKWRQYSIDTFSKNTVLVDGLPQRRPRNQPEPHPPIEARWESTPDHDFAAGIYNEAYGDKGLHPATHYRRVYFHKPDLAIVADTLTPNDSASHTYQARWHLMTTKTRVNDATHEVVTTDENMPNLDIVPLNPEGLDVRMVAGQTNPELLGWNVLHNTVKQPESATAVLQTRQGAGVQTFLTLLVPMQTGTGSPVESVQPTGSDSAVVTFNNGRIVTIKVDPDTIGTIQIVDSFHQGKTASTACMKP